MGLEESCCQPKRVYAGIKGENLSFLCPKGMYLFRLLNWVYWHGMVRWTKWENKESWGWRGEPCSSAQLAEFGGVPLAQVGSGCTEQKLPPLLSLCLPEPRQPPEPLCLPSSRDCALQSRKAMETKEKFPKRKAHPESLSLAAEFLCWRILELFTFLTLFGWTQVQSGGAIILFLHLWGWKAPLTGGQTDLPLSLAYGGISNAS